MERNNRYTKVNNRIVDSYVRLKENKIPIQDFIKNIQLTVNDVKELSSEGGINAADKAAIVENSLEDIEDCFEQGEDLRLQAFIVEIYNNLAHAFDKCDNKKSKYKFMEAKDDAIHDLVEMFEKQGNKCYGITEDPNRRENAITFDIPATGQISWHIKDEDEYAYVKNYPYKYYNKESINSKEVDSVRVLKNDITVNEMKLWPKDMKEHYLKVQESFDSKELNKNLTLHYYQKNNPKCRILEFGEGKDITSKDLENAKVITSSFKTKEKCSGIDR